MNSILHHPPTARCGKLAMRLTLLLALLTLPLAAQDKLPPTAMPRDAREPRPKPRDRKEVEAVLAGAPTPPEKTRQLRVVLVAGKKDHGPGEHDYPAWQKAWAELLAAADDIRVTAAWEWPKADDFRTADAIVFYQHGSFTPERAKDIDAFLERGGGLVYVHWA